MNGVTIEQLQADLAARDALIGELRAALADAVSCEQSSLERCVEAGQDWKAPVHRALLARWTPLLARLPKGAELERIAREVTAEARAEVEAEMRLKAELNALRAQLATAEAELRRKGAQVADLDAELEDTKKGLREAEARVRELEESANFTATNTTQLVDERARLKVRLRAVTEAVKTARAEEAERIRAARDHNDRLEYDGCRSGYLSAVPDPTLTKLLRTLEGDLPHPDTALKSAARDLCILVRRCARFTAADITDVDSALERVEKLAARAPADKPKRFIVLSGWCRPVGSDDRVHLSFEELCYRYKVDPAECIDGSRDTKATGLPHLVPRNDGNYVLPQ